MNAAGRVPRRTVEDTVSRMKSQVRVLSSKSLYNGRILRVKLDRVVEPGGVEASREVVEHHGSVVVIPRLPKGHIILVRQFRYPARRHMWELVAGSMEPGESVIRAARRELQEETGYRAGSLKRLFSFYPSPGFLTEQMHLVEARDLTLSKAAPEEDEQIEVAEFSKIQIDKLLREKKVIDGKTLVGLLWDRWRGGVGKANRNN
jgi:ADP-ribose pyrophosphatase